MCTIDGCSGRAKAKGLCMKHYMRARRTGDPAKTRKPGRKNDKVFALCDQLCRYLTARSRARYPAPTSFLEDADLAKAIDYLRRLQRIRPDLAEKVIAGEMSAQAAAIEATRRERR
jgi:hypothetical protein